MDLVTVDGEDPNPAMLARAVTVLRGGRLLIYPTDTLYALGGLALDGAAVDRVRLAKGREEWKPLPLVAADLEQVNGLCSSPTDALARLARRFWPGPLTLVLPAAAGVPEAVTAGTDTVAVRVPALALVRRLCAEAGPLVSTSANPAGAPPPRTCHEAVVGVGRAAALALDGGTAPVSLGSTIVDLTQREPRLLRPGPIAWDAVAAALREA
ncbi:MAG TPA: L-threonylcarbamoyladenylate synthase [Vicinamibacteria bacterium]